jgi:hypothetical protein
VSDSQVERSRDWYTAMQRKHAAQAKARLREVEERVHAILSMEDMLTKAALCNQLIAAHPDEALEILQAGGRDVGRGVLDGG